MGTWKCPACDSFNPDSVDECLTCGATRHGLKDVIDGSPREVLVSCPACKGNNALNRTICQWCGAPLPVGPGGDVGDATNPMLQPPAELDGEPTDRKDPFRIPEPSDPVFEEDGPTAPSLQIPAAGNVRREAGKLRDGPVGSGSSPQAQGPASRETRSCFTCGISLGPDEWVLVAGPRILCRACFHEEFGRNRNRDESGTDASSHGEAVADDSTGRALPRQGRGWLVAGSLLVAGGMALTFTLGFVWGFTPLAGGVVLGTLGMVQWVAGRKTS